jgi:hypothetical protein
MVGEWYADGVAERVGYCARCRIGAIDEQGLCSLCGAPQRPPTRLSRLLEQGGLLLDLLLNPLSLGVLALAVVLLVTAVAAQLGAHVPAIVGGPRGAPGPFEPTALLEAARADPLGALWRFLLPAMVQALLFGLLLLLAVLLWRRRPPRRPPTDHELSTRLPHL